MPVFAGSRPDDDLKPIRKSLVAPVFPAVLSSVGVSLRVFPSEERPRHCAIRVQIWGPDGPLADPDELARTVSLLDSPRGAWPVPFNRAPGYFTVDLQSGPLELPVVGPYELRILLNQEHVRTVYLDVRVAEGETIVHADGRTLGLLFEQ